MSNIAILGSGAWGTALANLMANNGNHVKIWAINPSVAEEINEKNTNKDYLPGVILSNNITAYEGLKKTLIDTDAIFLVVPSQAVRSVSENIIKEMGKDYKNTIVICSKGIEEKSFKFMSDIVEEVITNSEIAVLSGPNFAKEVAIGIPTVTTIATKEKKVFDKLSKLLDCETFKCYYTDDALCTEICGTMKNIIAIACGMVEGLEWGKNTLAALITKGIYEIGEMSTVLGGNTDVLAQPAGLGDLVLTCTSTQSRNMLLGFKLGKGLPIDEVLKSKKATFEGYVNAQSAVAIAKKYGIKLDLCEAVHTILEKEAKPEEIKKILVKVI